MATLKDVAREAGLTVGTVSRVLNNRGYVSEKTREKVYEVMKELGYQPNEMARALATQRSNLIAVIVPHIEHPYFAKLISCLEAAAYERRYKILLFSSKGREKREEECVEMCKSSRVAGIIVCSGSLHMDKFVNAGCPVVTIERSIGGSKVGMESDNYLGAVLATEHLIERGCKYLLHIAGVGEGDMPAHERQRGFAEVCQKKGVQQLMVRPKRENYDTLNYYSLIADTLKRYPQIDGVFASSDLIAAQTLQVCQERNILVPEQVKIVGFDDSILTTLVYPRLTTIHQPVDEMAKAAIAEILDVGDAGMMVEKQVFPVTLVRREST